MIQFLKQRTKRIEHFQANTVAGTQVNMQATIRFAKAKIFFQIVLKIGLMENASLSVNNISPVFSKIRGIFSSSIKLIKVAFKPFVCISGMDFCSTNDRIFSYLFINGISTNFFHTMHSAHYCKRLLPIHPLMYIHDSYVV